MTRYKSVNQGSKNPQAKLDEQKVREIRRLAKVPHYLPTKELAKRFGVSCVTINQVIARMTWLHVN